MKVEIGSKEWLNLRRKYITATDAACIMLLNPYETALDRYNAKINGTIKERNAAMQRGLDLEPLALLTFEQHTGYMVKPEWRVHHDIKWMAATFDGISEEGIAVEIKCPGEKDHLISCEGKVPDHYMPQLQHQMKVAEIDFMYYFSYRPEHKISFNLIRVDADRDFQDKMLGAEKAFYECLVNKRPPSPCSRDIVLRENRSFLRAEAELHSIRMRKKKLEEDEIIIKQALIDQCQGQASKGYKLKICPIEIEGRIDYEKALADYQIKLLDENPDIRLPDHDLESYRKPSTQQWRTYEI